MAAGQLTRALGVNNGIAAHGSYGRPLDSGGCCVRADDCALAAAGEFNVKTIGEVSSSSAISGTLRIVGFNGTASWPPGAYIGFYQGPNRNQSVQFLVMRNREKDSHLVAGYRIVEDGRETKVESLTQVPLKATLRVILQFRDGIFSLVLDDAPAITVRTPFKEVAPYVSVSSGSAEFEIDP